MPNHITNRLTFSGDQKKIDELISKVKSFTSDFDFNTFYPMPDDLIGTRSPSNIVSQQDYDAWFIKNKIEGGNEWEKCMTQKMSDDLNKKYGADNWYDWTIKNWGTKWNAYNVDVSSDEIVFQTAWSTPFNAMLKLSETFPDVTIQVRYFDEDFGANVGEYQLWNGGIEDEYAPENGSEDAYRLAIDIDGSDSHYSDWLADENDWINLSGTYYDTCVKLNHEKDYPFDDFPSRTLNKLLDLAINDENYERANKIKELINKNSNEQVG